MSSVSTPPAPCPPIEGLIPTLFSVSPFRDLTEEASGSLGVMPEPVARRGDPTETCPPNTHPTCPGNTHG